MTDFESRRQAFGNRLREIRENAGMSGTDLANALGWQQPKVSKIERGRQTASDSDVVAWLNAFDVAEEQLERMRAELRDLQIAQLSWRRQLREGHHQRQEDEIDEVRAASVMRSVAIMVVPGLLQTPDHARAIFRTQADLLDVPDDDIEQSVTARMAQQQVLYDRSKRIEILITEAALCHPVCASTEFAAQLDRLVSVVGLPHVRVGIIPAHRAVPHLIPHGFWIVDDEVWFESVAGEHRVTDSDEVALYNKLTDRLWTVAVEGDQARALLLRILEAVRQG